MCRITRKLYEAMVEGYRNDSGFSPTRVARVAGTTKDTARKAWLYGWPSHGYRPICDVIAEEQVETRAQLQRMKEETERLEMELEAKRRQEVREKAMADVTESRKQEAQLARLARGASVQVLATITNVSAGAAKVGAQVRAALDDMAAVDPATGKPKALTAAEAASMVRLLGSLTQCLRQANDAGRTAMDMERVLLGEPTHVVGHIHVGPISMAEAEERITRANRALERAKRIGAIEGEVVDADILPVDGGEGGEPMH